MISILIELQRLKGLERTGWMLRGLPRGTESVASHSFGVCVTAMVLADAIVARGVTVDTERLLRIALLHDWAEVRIGDVPRTATGYFGAETRRRAEYRAFAELVRGAGPGADSYCELYEDYEGRNSVEARLAKAADVIDLLVQVLALERAGALGLDEFWDAAQSVDFQLGGVAHEVVSEVLQAILRARGEPRPLR